MDKLFIAIIFIFTFRRNTSGNSRTTPTMSTQPFVKMEMPDFDSNQQYIVYTD